MLYGVVVPGAIYSALETKCVRDMTLNHLELEGIWEPRHCHYCEVQKNPTITVWSRVEVPVSVVSMILIEMLIFG